MVMGRTVVRREASVMGMVMDVMEMVMGDTEMVEVMEGKVVMAGMEVTGAKGVMAKGEMEATETMENKVMVDRMEVELVEVTLLQQLRETMVGEEMETIPMLEQVLPPETVMEDPVGRMEAVAILLLQKKVEELLLNLRAPHRIPLCRPARAARELEWILAIWLQLLKKPTTRRGRII